jgi:uncharacterized membrane protein YkvA (DUF1232 family)
LSWRDDLTEASRYWLRAAMLYFVYSQDDEPDLSSQIGFEDDCEALSACIDGWRPEENGTGNKHIFFTPPK